MLHLKDGHNQQGPLKVQQEHISDTLPDRQAKT